MYDQNLVPADEKRALAALNARRADRGRRPKCDLLRPGQFCNRLAGHPREHHWVKRTKPTDL